MINAIADVLKITPEVIQTDDLSRFCAQHAIVLGKDQQSWGYRLYALFEKLVEPDLVQPTFITHFPVEVSPLAKEMRKTDGLLIVLSCLWRTWS